MGLILDARCDACGFAQSALKLGATHAEIATHDVNTLELFSAPCCKAVQSVRVLMGHPYPETPCEGCAKPLPLAPDQRYRIATMKGEILKGHRCPSCGADRLSFESKGSFR